MPSGLTWSAIGLLCYRVRRKGAAALLAVGGKVLATALQALNGILDGQVLGIEQILLGTAASIVIGVGLLELWDDVRLGCRCEAQQTAVETRDGRAIKTGDLRMGRGREPTLSVGTIMGMLAFSKNGPLMNFERVGALGRGAVMIPAALALAGGLLD